MVTEENTIIVLGTYFNKENVSKVTDYNGWSVIYKVNDDIFNGSILSYVDDLRLANKVIGANTYEQALVTYNRLNGNKELCPITYDIDNLSYAKVFGFKPTKEQKSEELRLKLAYAKYLNHNFDYVLDYNYYVEVSICKDDTRDFCLENSTLLECKGYVDGVYVDTFVCDLKTYTNFINVLLKADTSEQKNTIMADFFAIITSFPYNDENEDEEWLKYIGTEEDYINENSFN